MWPGSMSIGVPGTSDASLGPWGRGTLGAKSYFWGGRVPGTLRMSWPRRALTAAPWGLGGLSEGEPSWGRRLALGAHMGRRGEQGRPW